MKTRLGLVALAVVLVLGPWLRSELKSQQPSGFPTSNAMSLAEGASSSAAAGNLISTVQTLPGGRTQVIIVDVSGRTMATYAVLAETGGIELKSVRNIDADLRLKDFNGMKPTPDEVRAVVQP